MDFTNILCSFNFINLLIILISIKLFLQLKVRAGVEMAVIDAVASSIGVPLWRLFGGVSNTITTDITVTFLSLVILAVKSFFTLLVTYHCKKLVPSAQASCLCRSGRGGWLLLVSYCNEYYSFHPSFCVIYSFLGEVTQ